MGAFYLIFGTSFFYPILFSALTAINLFVIPVNSKSRKFIRNWYFTICLSLSLLIVLLTNGDSALHELISYLGIIGLSGSLILQFFLGVTIWIAGDDFVKNDEGEWVDKKTGSSLKVLLKTPESETLAPTVTPTVTPTKVPTTVPTVDPSFYNYFDT
jgi:hypothetical protein